MNILFLSAAAGADYQCDMLLHGLKTMFGDAVVDYPRVNYLYQDYGDVSNLYGKGFTLYGILPTDRVYRDRIVSRIEAREFDLIVYGSIQRSHELLDLVLAHYPKHQVILVDGEDHTNILNELKGCGLYFKRELYAETPGVHPIHFAIPVIKVGTIRPVIKSQVRADLDPADRSTYTYKEERYYYQGYARSLFAWTQKKAGWDCLRHLEIMANGTIPLFRDLDQCPPLTCIHLPKAELMEAWSLRDYDGNYWSTEEGHAVWRSLWRRIHMKFIMRSTTVALAQYVLDTQQREAA